MSEYFNCVPCTYKLGASRGQKKGLDVWISGTGVKPWSLVVASSPTL